ncbi:interferon-induced very large GTPase 1-like [Anneissia japonica]|uniref:interferon-induced very large GTPase 1-like n=1 Tax=Anneissia japonica TaxID=1529436 RepID=UPI00142557C9|nr:interferon-induced very large GTPase 1-like [Anneissia japonica]
MGHILSMLYNVLEYAVNAVSFWRLSELQCLIQDVGLDAVKWTKILREVLGVNDILQLKAIAQNHEAIRKVIERADKYEISGLHELFDITQDEEQSITESENNLCVRLKELGLDERHWLSILKTKFAVSNMDSVKHIGLDSLNDLKHVCQTRNELMKLQNLFGIDNEYPSFALHFVKVQNRIRLIMDGIKQIKSLLSNGKTRSCKSVHAKEQSFREILLLTSANWIRPNTSLEEVLNDLSKLSCFLEAPIPTQDLLPSHLIQSSSCGVCLKGVLYTGNGNYIFSANYPVLKAPSTVRLNGSNLSITEVIIDGDDEHVKSFIEHTDKYGCVSEYVNLPSSNGNKSTARMKKNPIASFTFRRDELRFSDSALEHLKRIGTMIDVDEIRGMECCKEFLNIYGSHIFQGPFHFGGVHWITATGSTVVARGDVDTQAINLESIAAFDKAPLGRFGLSSEYDAKKEKGKIRIEYKTRNSKCSVIKAVTSGGHKTFSYLPTWKLGMSADISSWNVIDRGTGFTVAIWEILNENYSSHIENASTISYYLFKAWVDMSNVHHIFNISSELQYLINEARTYVTSLENIDVTDGQRSILENLLKIKENVIKHTRSIRAWSDIFLGSKAFDILNVLKRLMNSPIHDTLAMVFKVINDNDMLNQPCVSNDKLNEYRNWLHILEKVKEERNGRNNQEISEFSDFTLLLEKAIMDLEDQRQHTSSNVAAYLSTAVIRLVNVFQRQNRLSDAKFLLALTTPLGFSETTGFLHTKLTIQDISNLVLTVKNNVSTYTNMNDEERKSVFIFSTLLESTMLTGDCYNLKHKLKKSTQDLPREIRDTIDSLENEDPDNWMKIEFYIQQYYGQINSHDQDLSLRSSLFKAMHCDKEIYGSRNNIPNIYELKPQCPDIIKVLNLERHFPKKITRQKALMVSENVILRDDLQHISNIPWYLLQSIILCNYDGLFLEPNQTSMNYSGGKTFSALLNTPATVNKGNSTAGIQFNPADVLVALFMCADDFLRQLIMEKLTMCQLSIPLLLPLIVDGSHSCEMLLWATRTIKKQWKTYSGTSCERSMSLHPIPIVSALRIGRLSKSKSKMLNAVINDQKHDVFFHYGSNGGNIERTISTGLLELTWYLPTGRNRDKFADALAIMNLRGNASHLKDQTAFLSEVSFATIAFITPDMLDKYGSDLLELLYQQNGYLVIVSVGPPGKDMTKLLLSLEQRYSKGEDPPKQSVLIYSSEKNELQMSGEIRSTLNYLLSKERCGVPKRSIEKCSAVWKNIGFYVDEDTKECLDAKADAEEMLTSLQHQTGDSDNAEEKIKLLPLQMIAIEIAERNRELCQLKQKGNMATEQYIDKVQSDLNRLRIKQKYDCSCFSNLIKIFMKSFSYPPLNRKYFYCWVKIMADQCSINQLQPVREEYNAKWNQLCNAVYKNQNKPTTEIESSRKILDELQRKLTNLSVGLEHFNREIAQIYEMVLHFKLPTSSYSVQRFPMVAADMLLEGHPLELMDGDASHVPIKWIKDVMSCLKNKMGNKRLFVLSVLGVQSTGKRLVTNMMTIVQSTIGHKELLGIVGWTQANFVSTYALHL